MSPQHQNYFWDFGFVMGVLVVVQSSLTSSLPISNSTTGGSTNESGIHGPLEEEGKAYWIHRRSPDYTLLYVTIPICAGILLVVLVFFLWVFSSKQDSFQHEQFDYEQLNEEGDGMGEPSSSSRPQPEPSPPASPAHPVLDQIFDLPYTNPVESGEDPPPP